MTLQVTAFARWSTACLVKPHLVHAKTVALLPADFFGSRRQPQLGQNSMNKKPLFIFS
jgi:hypothetical protein